MSFRADTVMRTCLFFVALCGALFAPWWVPGLCMLVLALGYGAWEVPIIGAWVDLVWLPNAYVAMPLFTLFGIAVAWIAVMLRRHLLV